MTVLDVLYRYREAFAGGVLTTLELFVLACVIGTFFGCAIAGLYQFAPSWCRQMFNASSFFITAIPALVVLFWFHFPLQSVLGIVIHPFKTAALTLIVLNSLAVARMLVDAIEEFPKQYLQAAMVCGMNRRAILLHIQAPLLARMLLPRWIDQHVVILHSTIFASLISVDEIFRIAQRVNATIYQPVAIYTAMALIFLVTTGPALLIARRLRNQMFRDFSER